MSNKSNVNGYLAKNKINPLIYLSGADRSIIKQLPKHDRNPYLRIGLYNLIIGIIVGIFSLWGLKYFFYETRYIIAFIIFCIIITVQIFLSRELINSGENKDKFFYILWGVIVFLIPSFIFLIVL